MKLIIATVLLIGATLPGLACEMTPAMETRGAAYCVATNGDDANPGTFDQPWRTIAKANQELQPGDTVYIREGTYNEVIGPTRSGTADEKITYANYSGESVILRGKAGEGAVVDLSNNHAVVVGFTIDRPHDGRKDKFGWVEIKGNHNTVRDCTIDKPGDPLAMYRAGYRERGILVYGEDNIIESNHIRGHNQGIHMSKTSRRTTIRNNTISGTSQSPIVVETSLGKIRGLLIEGNTLEQSAIEDGIQFMQDFDAPDPSADISNFGTVVRGNVIRYNAENAIDLKGAAHVVIENNIIYGTVGSNDGPLDGWNRNSFGTIMKGSMTGSGDVIIRNNVLYDNAAGIRPEDGYKVYNNTIIGNNRDYTGSGSNYVSSAKPVFWGIYNVSGDQVAIKNNIVVGHNIVEISLRTSRITHINNNLYHNTDNLEFADFIANGNWSTYSFAEWKAHLEGIGSVSGNDNDSIVGDPKFIDAPERPVGDHQQFDFHLQDISPAIDAGGPLTRVKGSGSGNQIQVEDAGYFFDGYGATDGDLVQIGPNTPVRIISVDYDSNIITFDRTVSWQDGDRVGLPYDGAAPDIGAYEFDGDSPPPPPPPESRVTDGLQVLYTFEEGSGATVRDVSGVGTPLNLTIENGSATSRLPGALSVNSPVVISSAGAATKIIDACRTTNEITLEAWIKPANTSQDGPARIVTLSPDTHSRNFMLAQGLWGDQPSDVYDIRLRTTEQSQNGQPSLSSPPGALVTEVTHVVYTREASGVVKIYVNGTERASGTTGGELSNWAETYHLGLANELTGDRPWLGEFHLVAIFSRALSQAEVSQNFNAGPGVAARIWLPLALTRCS